MSRCWLLGCGSSRDQAQLKILAQQEGLCLFLGISMFHDMVAWHSGGGHCLAMTMPPLYRWWMREFMLFPWSGVSDSYVARSSWYDVKLPVRLGGILSTSKNEPSSVCAAWLLTDGQKVLTDRQRCWQTDRRCWQKVLRDRQKVLTETRCCSYSCVQNEATSYLYWTVAGQGALLYMIQRNREHSTAQSQQ